MEYTSDISLSIIIPVFNCEPYLISGFEKLKPIYSFNINFEIIYVNDGSTDKSLEVLREIEKNNANVKVLSQENQGSSGARNLAIEIAKGLYIQFLDSDDYIDITEVLKLLNRAQRDNIDALSYRLDFINENGTRLGIMDSNIVPYNKIISGKESLISGYQPSSICVFLFKTAFLNKHQLRITPKITHMDVEFTSRMMLFAERVLFVKNIAYHYLQRDGSITKPKSKEKLQQFLYDEVIISNTIRNTIESSFKQELTKAIQKNYNSVIWNLLWRLSSKTNEVDFDFKLKCIADLKALGLYPIKGALKSNFQRFSCLFFNQEWLLKFFFKIERLIEKKVPTNHILNLTSEKEHKKRINLSIIIPVYNSEEFLQRCFESVCNLSNLLPLEVIFVNDGSTDNSLSLLNSMKQNHNFVKVISQSNQGLSAARNTGINHATGDCFLLLDSDDWLNEDEFSNIIDVYIKNNLDFISYGLSYYDGNNNFTANGDDQLVEYNQIFKGIEFLHQGYQPSSACLFIFNTNFIKNNNLFFIECIMQEDVEFTFRMMLKAEKGIFTNFYVYNYFRHQNSMTLTKDKDRLKMYLNDSIKVADFIKKNKNDVLNFDYFKIIEKNYNSVVWNLFWRFFSKPKEVDFEFKMQCIADLKKQNLYPIKGALKSNFQKLTTLFFNQEWLLKLVFKIRA